MLVYKIDTLYLGTLSSSLIINPTQDLLFLLQTQVLRVRQVNEPCIGLTQENSVQDCLPYILKSYGLCYSTSSLP